MTTETWVLVLYLVGISHDGWVAKWHPTKEACEDQGKHSMQVASEKLNRSDAWYICLRLS